MSDVFDKVISHLEFIGYVIEKKGETDVFANFTQGPNLIVREPIQNFVLIQGTYNILDKGKKDTPGLLAAINTMNSKLFLTHMEANLNNWGLTFVAFYNAPYDKAIFANFITRYQNEINVAISSEGPVRQYLV